MVPAAQEVALVLVRPPSATGARRHLHPFVVAVQHVCNDAAGSSLSPVVKPAAAAGSDQSASSWQVVSASATSRDGRHEFGTFPLEPLEPRSRERRPSPVKPRGRTRLLFPLLRSRSPLAPLPRVGRLRKALSSLHTSRPPTRPAHLCLAAPPTSLHADRHRRSTALARPRGEPAGRTVLRLWVKLMMNGCGPRAEAGVHRAATQSRATSRGGLCALESTFPTLA